MGGVKELEIPELDSSMKEAFHVAYENIKKFHEAQQTAVMEVETMPGVICQRMSRPIGQLRSLMMELKCSRDGVR